MLGGLLAFIELSVAIYMEPSSLAGGRILSHNVQDRQRHWNKLMKI